MFCISRSGRKKKVSDYCEDLPCSGLPRTLKETSVMQAVEYGLFLILLFYGP